MFDIHDEMQGYDRKDSHNKISDMPNLFFKAIVLYRCGHKYHKECVINIHKQRQEIDNEYSAQQFQGIKGIEFTMK